jgi:hypothetical protein
VGCRNDDELTKLPSSKELTDNLATSTVESRDICMRILLIRRGVIISSTMQWRDIEKGIVGTH